MRVLVAALLAVAVTAGCVGLDRGACGEEAGDLHTPWVDGSFLRTDPGQPWDTVVLQRRAEDADASAHPAGWAVESHRLSPDGELNFSLLRVAAHSGHG